MNAANLILDPDWIYSELVRMNQIRQEADRLLDMDETEPEPRQISTRDDGYDCCRWPD